MSESKYFFISSQLNNLVFDIEGGNTADGTKVVTWERKDDASDNQNQLWFVDSVNKTIRSRLDENLCLSVEPNSNTLIVERFQPGRAEQRWTLVEDRIQHAEQAQRVLDIASANTEAGARICAWDYHEGANQHFTFLYQKPKYFIIKSKMHGKILDVYQGIETPGAAVVMWPMGDGAPGVNQLWYEDRNGYLRCKLNDFVMDTSGGRLVLNPFNGSSSQMWVKDGQRIVNVSNKDRCLDIERENQDDAAAVCEYDYHGSDNQHWEFQEY